MLPITNVPSKKQKASKAQDKDDRDDPLDFIKNTGDHPSSETQVIAPSPVLIHRGAPLLSF